MGKRKQVVAGEGKNGPTTGLYARNRDQIHDSKAAECEEDCGDMAHDIEEELCNLELTILVLDRRKYGTYVQAILPVGHWDCLLRLWGRPCKQPRPN